MESACDWRFEEARRLLDEERDHEAEQAFSDLIALYPEWEGAYGNRGLARMHLGRDDDALQDFEAVVRLNPSDAMGFARMSEALRNLHRYEESLCMVARALELDPQDPDAVFMRGWLFLFFGQYRSALLDFDRYLEISDEPGEAEDLKFVCETLVEHQDKGTLTERKEERVLLEHGFSQDLAYRSDFESLHLFCPYAHCVRIMPARGPEAPAACLLTGYDCPGGEQQAGSCRTCPPADF